METISKNNIEKFVGKRITSRCRQYQANHDIYGRATILSVDMNQRNPIMAENLTGEGRFILNAFINTDGYLCIGDSDRIVYTQPY